MVEAIEWVASRDNNEMKPHVHYRFVLSSALLFCSPASFAEISSLSRANCLGLNESVTWDWPFNEHFTASVTSAHTRWGESAPSHVLMDPNEGQPGWRFYAGDAGDLGIFTVEGVHVWATLYSPEITTTHTAADNCNLTEW